MAHLAATLACRYPVPHGQPPTGRTAGEDWTLVRDEADQRLNRFYHSLLSRAEMLLSMAESRHGYVHAFQLFDPNRRYTADQLARIFTGIGWRGLTSPNSVRKLLEDARDALTDGYTSKLKWLKQQRQELLTATKGQGAGHLAPLDSDIQLVESAISHLDSDFDSDKTQGGVRAHEILYQCGEWNLLGDKLIKARQELKPSVFGILGVLSPPGFPR